MPQPMEGNHWQLAGFGLVCIVVVQNILQCLVRGVVGHHLSVVLGENPVFALPVVAHTQAVAGLFQPQLSQLFGYAVGDGDFAVAVPGLWHLDNLLIVHHGSGLCDSNSVIFKIHIIPGQSQNLTLPQPRIDCQGKQNLQLLRQFLGAGVVRHCILFAGIVCPSMAFGVDYERMFYKVQKKGGLLGREEFDFVGGVLCLHPDGRTGIPLYDLPFNGCPQDGGKHIAYLVDRPLAVSSWLTIAAAAVFAQGQEEGIDHGRPQLCHSLVADSRENEVINDGVVLLQRAWLQIVGGRILPANGK